MPRPPQKPPRRGGKRKFHQQRRPDRPKVKRSERAGLSERPIREDLVRAASLECLGGVLQERHLADRVLERVLRREARLYSNERRAVAERVYGVLRRLATLDFAIDKALKGGAKALTSVERDTVRLAGARVLEGEPRERVEQSSGLRVDHRKVLDVLHDLPAAMAGLPDIERVVAQGSVPRFLAELLVKELGLEDSLALMAALNTRGPLTARVNTLKTTREALVSALERQEVQATPGHYSPWALHLGTRVNAFSLPEFQQGQFELQDEGSQLLALILGAKPGEQVVDACAGAGGKSLAIAAMMQNRGELFALDADAARLEELKPRARRAGVSIARSRPIPADELADVALADLQSRADRVLVDAPCSGLGALRRNPDARWRLTADDLPRFAALQKTLLERFSKLVKPGGLLVYATCSFARAEDEDVVAAARLPGFERVSVRELLGDAGALLDAGQDLRLWPHRTGTDGFYAAAFRRRA